MPEIVDKNDLRNYLVSARGFCREAADVMVSRHSNVIESGIRMRSFDYYIANEVEKAERRHLEINPDELLPDAYYDENWKDPDDDLDEEEEEDDEDWEDDEDDEFDFDDEEDEFDDDELDGEDEFDEEEDEDTIE